MPETLSVPKHLLSAFSGGEHYVLRVVGQHMLGEGIADGDYLICQRREEAEPGSLVVALIGDESTCRRYYREGDVVRLVAAHGDIPEHVLPAAKVQIQAAVVGLMRKYEPKEENHA